MQEPRGRRLVAGQGSPAGGQMRLDSGQSLQGCAGELDEGHEKQGQECPEISVCA